jgi:hypothetical protein
MVAPRPINHAARTARLAQRRAGALTTANKDGAVIFKTKKIVLTYPHFDQEVPLTPIRPSDSKFRVYRVKKVVGSVEYTPGQFLRRETVEDLCAMNDWVVVVKEAK